jgi:hypothetical protein
MALHYDNDASYLNAPVGYVAVERVYALRFSEFNESDWKRLQETYEGLPGWAGTGSHGCSCWFSSEEVAPYLVASVEPSGLQVSGVLRPQEWYSWHEALSAKLSQFPVFEV